MWYPNSSTTRQRSRARAVVLRTGPVQPPKAFTQFTFTVRDAVQTPAKAQPGVHRVRLDCFTGAANPVWLLLGSLSAVGPLNHRYEVMIECFMIGKTSVEALGIVGRRRTMLLASVSNFEARSAANISEKASKDCCSSSSFLNSS